MQTKGTHFKIKTNKKKITGGGKNIQIYYNTIVVCYLSLILFYLTKVEEGKVNL